MKLAWGIAHAKSLQEDCEVFALDSDKQPFFKVRANYNTKRHGFVVTVYDMHALPDEWGLRMGDIAQAFRSALDHLAWALVERGSRPPRTLTESQQRAVQFPICDTRAQFNNTLSRRLPGVGRAEIALIRHAQPYIRGVRSRHRHTLSILAAINNDDKHRTIQPVEALPAGANYEVTYSRDCLVTSLTARATRVTLHDGAELTLIRARKLGPDPHIEVNSNIPAKPAVGNRAFLEEWINLTPSYIAALLNEFSKAPPEAVALIPTDE
jgi:hypothetical protein